MFPFLGYIPKGNVLRNDQNRIEHIGDQILWHFCTNPRLLEMFINGNIKMYI